MRQTLIALVSSALLLATTSLTAEQRRRPVDTLNVGDKAPTFALEYLSNGKMYKLRDSFGKKPTVLIFGSYT